MQDRDLYQKTNEISLRAAPAFCLEAISRLSAGGVILTELVRLAERRQRWSVGGTSSRKLQGRFLQRGAPKGL